MDKKYTIGLDIGTNSVGWAIVEADTQKIIKKGTGNNRKALWGVRLFDAAVTAKERRQFRSTRRRYDRRRERIHLLQEEFQKEINQVDANFYKKLAETKFHEQDSANKTVLLTTEEKAQIKEYYQQYPTIYHLRNELVEDSSKKDIRLVYLAIHHIIKYRGNFLYSGESFSVDSLDVAGKLKQIFDLLAQILPGLNIPEDYWNMEDIDELSNIVMEKSKSDIKVKVEKFFHDIPTCKQFSSEFAKLIIGNKFSIKKLLSVDDLEKDTICFSDGSYDEIYADLESALGEKIEILDAFKELFDIIFLKKLFNGSKHTQLSSLMVAKYQQHKEDLKFLKLLFQSDRNSYNKLFRTSENTCLYEQYIHNQKNYDEFISGLNNLLGKIFEKNVSQELINQYSINIKPRILNGEFLPRITSSLNGQFPYQLNKDELIKIIENQGKYYPFLKDKINGKYKIVQLLEFRIPYYVGPLVSKQKSNFAWMERKKDHVKITPYNFEEVVDKELSAERFIQRMISHCTYLLKEPALPNSSILYSRFKVLNELKQIRVNGEKLSCQQQQQIFEQLFLKSNGVITNKKLQQYLNQLDDFKMYEGDLHITGYSADNKFANNMQSYYDFFGKNGIFEGTAYNEEDADCIIEWATIFEDKEILKQKIQKNYEKLSEIKVNQILNKKYSGWGSLSKKLLTELYVSDKTTGNAKNLLDLLYETSENFMQILNNEDYQFQKMIKEHNQIEDVKKLSYDVVRDLATSPATKKGIYQSLLVVQELVHLMGHDPESIVIEMARENGKKERTEDRKSYLLNLYKKVKETIDNYNQLFKELNEQEKINSQKLYLYFIQEGKCLYSGKPLNIEDLNSYEIDHILPRTLVPDNSVDNLALVYRECNQNKRANLVLPKEYQNHKNIEWWKHLRSIGLMSPKKFYNLMRKEFKEEDIQGFIARQLVETRQITKHVANIMSSFYKKTNIIYLKSSLSHHYRERYDLFKFRDINDYHHAHDAYLAAVLGEYKEKYMTRNINFDIVHELNDKIRELGEYSNLKYGYVINSLDDRVSEIIHDLSKNTIDQETGEILFDAKRFNQIVEDTLYRNDILISRKVEIRSGKCFKQTIYPKGEGKIRLKKNMPVEIYGGYKNVENAYMVLISYQKKNKTEKKIIGIPLEIAMKSKNNKQLKYEFIQTHLKLENDHFSILKDFIPFETLICYKNHDVYIKGYSEGNELSNAIQLKIPKEKMKIWKYVFHRILNHASISEEILSENNMLDYSKEIAKFLFHQKEKYLLFKNAVQNIEASVSLEDIDQKTLSKLITELLVLYQCNSKNANLKELGLGDRIGRLSGKNLDHGILKFQSVTGIREDTYEF